MWLEKFDWHGIGNSPSVTSSNKRFFNTTTTIIQVAFRTR